jgi:hypothetical protein
MVALATTLMVSCGKENKSGDPTNNNQYSNNGGFGGYNYGNINTNNMNLPGNWQNIVMNENPCQISTYQNGSPFNNNGTGRTRVVIPLNGVNINQGSVHIGVTPEGDIAIASNQAQGAVVELLLCPRPDLTGQGGLMNNPVLESDSSCPLSKITDTDISLSSNSGYGNYILQFAPIHIYGTDRYSSLCR